MKLLTSLLVCVNLSVVLTISPAFGDLSLERRTVGVVALDLNTVRSRAESFGPGVAPSRVGVAQADQAKNAVDVPLALPPRLQVDVARRSYPGALGAGGGAGVDVTASLWQDLSLGGYGSARVAYADSLRDQARFQADLARRDAVLRAMNAWVDARYARDLLDLRKQAEEVAKELLRIAEARVRAGTAPPSELALAQSVLGSTQAAVLQAEGLVVVADGELRYSLNLSADSELEPQGDLSKTDDRDIDEPRSIQLAQEQHPLVQLARIHVAVAQKQADVSVAYGRPFLGVGVSYSREASGDRIIGGGVSIPLPIVSPTVLDSAIARGNAAVGQARVADVQAQMAREVRQAIHERHHAREVRETLLNGAVEPGRRAMKEAARRYEAGAVELAFVLAARRELLSAEQGFWEAAADVLRADFRLEHALGGPLPRREVP
jgi:outer membrane protein TolC